MYRKWDVALLALIVLPGMIGLTQRLGIKVKRLKLLAQQSISDITHQVGESMTGLRVVKIFVNEDNFSTNFEGVCQTNFRQEVDVIRVRELVKFLSDVISGFGIGLPFRSLGSWEAAGWWSGRCFGGFPGS